MNGVQQKKLDSDIEGVRCLVREGAMTVAEAIRTVRDYHGLSLAECQGIGLLQALRQDETDAETKR